MSSGNCEFYEFDCVYATSAKFTDVSVFDENIEEYNDDFNTVDDASEGNVAPFENDTTSDDVGNDSIENMVDIPEDDQLPRRSGRIRQRPTRLTYEHSVSDGEDGDMAEMFVAHERCSYREATEDVE